MQIFSDNPLVVSRHISNPTLAVSFAVAYGSIDGYAEA
jgi:hypothetical protein